MAIKFDNTRHTFTAPFDESLIAIINPYRTHYHKKKWIGENRILYPKEPVYGNLSQIIGESIFISGSGTSSVEIADGSHYAMVEIVNSLENWVKSYGPVKPSSETMTHHSVYSLVDDAKFVFHSHYPGWRIHDLFDLPTTHEDADYGTQFMAEEFERLLLHNKINTQQRIIIMAGPEDGIVTWGDSALTAAFVMHQYAKKCEILIGNLFRDYEHKEKYLPKGKDISFEKVEEMKILLAA